MKEKFIGLHIITLLKDLVIIVMLAVAIIGAKITVELNLQMMM